MPLEVIPLRSETGVYNRLIPGTSMLQQLKPVELLQRSMFAVKGSFTSVSSLRNRLQLAPLETRMGKGKGEPDHWVAVVKPGTILFELAGVSKEAARECFARVAYKLPVKVRLVGRQPKI